MFLDAFYPIITEKIFTNEFKKIYLTVMGTILGFKMALKLNNKFTFDSF
jgi:hypothetical protein